MKNFTSWEWICIIFAMVIGIVIIISFIAPIIMNVATNEVNIALRMKLLEWVENISSGLMAIAAGKILHTAFSKDKKEVE